MRRNASNWQYKPCGYPGCQTLARYHAGDEFIPKFCYEHHRENKALHLKTAICPECNREFEYDQNKYPDAPPTQCPRCYRKKCITKECGRCRKPFNVLKKHADRKYCPSCADIKKANMRTKPCANHPNCHNVIHWDPTTTDREPIKYCPACHKIAMAENEKTFCLNCGAKFYYKSGSIPPEHCPHCRKLFRENTVTIICELCHVPFIWNKLWKMRNGDDTSSPEYCPKCLKDKNKIFIHQNHSNSSYEIIRNLSYYEKIGQIEHIIEGTSTTHQWTGVFTGFTISDIINAAADLAASTADNVMEFETDDPHNSENRRVIKFDATTSLVVIFNPVEKIIITTYVMINGLNTVINKILHHDWTGKADALAIKPID